MKNIGYFLLVLLLSLFLRGVAQKDTTDYTIKSWQVDAFLQTQECSIDTFLEHFQLYNPIHQRGYGYAFLGNVGQPYQNLMLLNRRELPFLFLSPYYDYLFSPDNAQFYNTKQAYTDFKYVTNFTKKNNLQNVEILHTQNILPNLNFGIQYRLLGALGEYQAQKTSDHFFRFFSSYQGQHYQAFLTYHYNKINGFLNGGITSDSLLNNPDYEINDTKLIPVNLLQSKTSILNRNINLRQSFSFSEHAVSKEDTSLFKQALMRWRIGHELDLNHNKRVYNNTGNSGFYQTFYIDTGAVRGNPITDSTGYQNIKNTVFFQLLDDTLSPLLPSVIVAYTLDNRLYQTYENKRREDRHWVQAKIFNPVFKHWYWSVGGQYELAQSDIKAKGLLAYYWGSQSGQNIQLEMGTSSLRPNFFYRHYHSNFYSWENDFKDTRKMYLGAHYQNKKLKLKVGIDQTHYNNFVYMGSVMGNAWQNDTTISYQKIYGIPKQHDKSFQVLTVYLQHQLDWKAFHMQNKLAFQEASSEAPIHLPKIQWYNSTYFQMRFFKRVMTVQLGFDLRLNTPYYAEGFIPATGLFYSQDEKKSKLYPYVDIFANIKVKRMRLFFKLEHVNQGLTGNHYYTALYHPMNPRVFRFGLSWRFYN